MRAGVCLLTAVFLSSCAAQPSRPAATGPLFGAMYASADIDPSWFGEPAISTGEMLLSPASDDQETWSATAFARVGASVDEPNEMHVVISEFRTRDPFRGVVWTVVDHIIIPVEAGADLTFGDQRCALVEGSLGPHTLLISQLDENTGTPVAAWTVTADRFEAYEQVDRIDCGLVDG